MSTIIYKHYATVNNKDELDLLYAVINRIQDIDLRVDEMDEEDEESKGGPYVTLYMTSYEPIDEGEFEAAMLAVTIDHDFNHEQEIYG